MKSKRPKPATTAATTESTLPTERGARQSGKTERTVPNITESSEQQLAAHATTTLTPASSTSEATPQTHTTIKPPAEGPTENETWEYITAEAILYCEGLGFDDYEIDVGEAFPIRLQNAHDIVAQMDYSRPIVTLVPIQIHFRMKKADADAVDNATLYRMVKDELYRLSNELPNLAPNSIAGWEILQFVTAVSLSDLEWSDESDEEYTEDSRVIALIPQASPRSPQADHQR